MKKAGKLILFLLFMIILAQGTLVFDTSRQVLSFWFNQLVPSLFTGMVFVQLCLDFGIFNHLGWLTRPLEKILFSNQAGLSLVFSCLFLGAPSGSSLLNQKVTEGQLSPQAAKRLASCLSLATPSFIVVTCGAVLLENVQFGFVLWIIQVFLCLFFLILWRSDKIELKTNLSQPVFFSSFKKAVKNSGLTLFYIGGYLMMFLTVFNLLSAPFPFEIKEMLKALGEFSIGCKSIGTSFFSPELKFSLMSAVLGFNGLCVHLQVFSMAEYPMSYPIFLFLRLIQSCLGFVVALILFSLLQ